MLSAKMKILQAIQHELEYSPISASLHWTVLTYLGMDGAAHAVGQLGIELRQLVLGVHAGVGDISHGSGLDDVPDDELLDSLILGAGLGTVGATNVLDMTTAVLGASIILPLFGHFDPEMSDKF